MSVKEFDDLLEAQKKMRKWERITDYIFYRQFKLCCLPWPQYPYYRDNSRHLRQPGLGI